MNTYNIHEKEQHWNETIKAVNRVLFQTVVFFTNIRDFMYLPIHYFYEKLFS